MLVSNTKFIFPTKISPNIRFFRTSKVVNKSVNVKKEKSLVQEEALDKELCILIDEKDNFTGAATKRECHTVGTDGRLLLHRAFSVLLFNSAGELLIQKRANKKVTYPGHFTNSCCSHPLLINNVPEDTVTAAIRRLDIELGIPKDKLDRKDFTLVNRFIYKDNGDGVWGEHELTYVMILKSDARVNPNPEEIEEVRYVAKENMDNFVANLKEPVTPWFKLMYRYMLPRWWDNLHRPQDIAQLDIRSFK